MLLFKHALIKCKTHTHTIHQSFTAKHLCFGAYNLRTYPNKICMHNLFKLNGISYAYIACSHCHCHRIILKMEWNNRIHYQWGKTKKFNSIDLFSTSFCGYNMQCRFHFFCIEPQNQEEKKSHRNSEMDEEGWQEQNYCKKYICGCISIEYITQIHAINISHKEKYNRLIIHITLTHTQHAKWFDISFMCIIWCFASICITSFFYYFVILIECTFNCIFEKFFLWFQICFLSHSLFFFLPLRGNKAKPSKVKWSNVNAKGGEQTSEQEKETLNKCNVCKVKCDVNALPFEILWFIYQRSSKFVRVFFFQFPFLSSL